MLSKEEQKLYFWLARDWARGMGATVDLGCFVGGSTARLAEGHRQAGHVTEIYAFDRFTAAQKAKRKHLYDKGIAVFGGHDTLPLAQSLLPEWSTQIQLVPGEIEDALWPKNPTEILVVDAGKAAVTADAIAQLFFPGLIAGNSVVVQQDLARWNQPWLAVQMALLSDHFQPVCRCGSGTTVVFLCTKPPTNP